MTSVIPAIIDNEEAWKAFSFFCTCVMRKKEEAERIRQGQPVGGQNSTPSVRQNAPNIPGRPGRVGGVNPNLRGGHIRNNNVSATPASVQVSMLASSPR
ncbi:hypothetical protein PUN28_020882 [Cardiocondyla obscurior]|uniref:Uncharacterized protein n=1 Tax=Cardiocondyla obscurior TaxID=286306 RepID=A0AAW2E9H6_9HYME